MTDDQKKAAVYGDICPQTASMLIQDILARPSPQFLVALAAEMEADRAMHAPKPGAEIVGPPRPPRCDECRYCVEEDTGHSCWTVEGVIADCLLGLNPGMPEDSFYGEEPALAFAEKCGRFSRGDGPHIDCDGDVELFSDDAEVQALLLAWREEKDKG